MLSGLAPGDVTDHPYAPATVGADGDWEPPNVVLVMADDLGYGDPGCYGGVLETPAIDRLAAEGTRFTDCYTGCPVCAPSRSVAVTGQHAGHTRVRGNFGQVGGARVVDDGPLQRRVPLAPGDPSLAEALSGAGYATGGFGKWGLGEAGTCGAPTRQGFDEWFGFLNQRRAHTYYPPFLYEGEERVSIDGNDGGDDGRHHAQDLVMERALAFVERHAGSRPFFCFVPTTLPHAPYVVPDAESAPPYGDRDWSEEERAYAAMVTRLDSDVGRLLDALEANDADEETLVLVCSDHDPAQRFVGGPLDSSGGLRGGKRDLYEGGIRTPMVARWPGRVPAGTVDDTPWYYADLLPTMAEVAGVHPDPGLDAAADADGTSVLPTLLGDDQHLDDRYLYWEFPHDGYGQAARYGDWKAVRERPTATLELYDLASDSGEKRDVAGEHPDVAAGFEWYLDRSHDPAPEWTPAPDRET
jgi:arylsulfatase A-like enzyme